MASHDSGGSSAEELSESGSSYVGSNATSSPVCRYRTTLYHDDECAYFFDCPSHTVERRLSTDEHRIDHGGASHTDAEDSAVSLIPEAVEERALPELPEDDAEPDSEPSAAAVPEPASQDVPEPSENNHAAEAREFALRTLESSFETPRPESFSRFEAPQRDATPRPEHEPSITLREALMLGEPSEAAEASSSADQESHPLAETSSWPLQASPETTTPTLNPPSSTPGVRRRPSPRGDPSEFSLPRWQPDAEVTLCPICGQQFSVFIRKHHCRKCGRVVCNSCSPHRIVIPHQYIVRPPTESSANRYSFLLGEELPGDFSTMGGGERVRLCNPCVPDPNTTPPQPQPSSSTTSPLSPTHQRSRSAVSSNSPIINEPSAFGYMGFAVPAHVSENFPRSRSATMMPPNAPISARRATVMMASPRQILVGTPPANFPNGGNSQSLLAGHSSGSGFPQFRSLLDVAGPSNAAASSSSHYNRPLPPAPQIAEEDECPVCHRELPSRDLSNFERAREDHITGCIVAHSAYSVGQRETTSASGLGTPPPRTIRRTGMFPYYATEKDCVDSAECTICLEEFEEGVKMARLECLCRFHYQCIRDWFAQHPGRCPVHQHDSYGY